METERSGSNNVYLLGEGGKGGIPGRRFPEYYAVAWLYKEPIATQVLLLFALVAYVLRFRRFDFRRNEWPIAATVLFFACTSRSCSRRRRESGSSWSCCLSSSCSPAVCCAMRRR
jgi:hypothetical protein